MLVFGLARGFLLEHFPSKHFNIHEVLGVRTFLEAVAAELHVERRRVTENFFLLLIAKVSESHSML